MKHINRYDNFIRLNEDVEIKGDINEYDINIIKVALIDLEDLGWNLYKIYKDNMVDNICIRLKGNTIPITECIRYYCKFNKNRFHLKSEYLLDNNDDTEHEPTKYEQLSINAVKECSQSLLNILDYDIGTININSFVGFFHKPEIMIILRKNKTK